MWFLICDVWYVLFQTWFFVTLWIFESRGDQKHPVCVISVLLSHFPKLIPCGSCMYTISCCRPLRPPKHKWWKLLKVSFTKHVENQHCVKWKYSLTLSRTMGALRRQHIGRWKAPQAPKTHKVEISYYYKIFRNPLRVFNSDFWHWLWPWGLSEGNA